MTQGEGGIGEKNNNVWHGEKEVRKHHFASYVLSEWPLIFIVLFQEKKETLDKGTSKKSKGKTIFFII